MEVDSSIVQPAPSYGKIGEALWRLTESTDGSLNGITRQDLQTLLQLRDDEIGLEITANGNPALLFNDLEQSFGVTEMAVYHDAVHLWMPLSDVTELNALASVKSVGMLTLPFTLVGAANSQGDQAQRTGIVRNFLEDPIGTNDLMGTGVTVAVISDSYNLSGNPVSAATDIGTGDLPGLGNPFGNTQPVTVFRDNRNPPNSRSDEGRAMLQIVHDVAPGANLVFSNDADQFGNPSEAAFAANIGALWQTQSADVIVDDLIYFTEPMFAEGPVAAAARQAVEAGVVYVTAAGNYSNDSYESPFRDSGQNIQVTFNGNISVIRAHDFDPGAAVDIFQRVTIPTNNPVGTPTTIDFQWDQPFGGVTTNFEVYAVDATTGFVVSQGFQPNPLNPVEIIQISNTSGVARPYDLLIGVNGALPAGVTNLKYVIANSGAQIIDFPTNSPSAFGHVLAPGVIGVGAANYFNTPEFGVTPPTLTGYSAVGPLDAVDVVAPDRVNTTFFGTDIAQDADTLPNFSGTSAAAPHVAALAALLLQVDPSLTPAGIEAALEQSAIDMDNPYTGGFDTGVDAATGAGLVDALGALGKVIDAPQLVGLTPGEYILVNDTRDLLDATANPIDAVIDIDLGMAGNQVSVRAATVAANAGGSNATTLLVKEGNYPLTLTGTGSTTQGDLDISGIVTIVGAGAGKAIIDATALTNQRHFDIASGANLHLARVTLTGGNAATASPGGNGGAIYVAAGGVLTLSDSALVDNTANRDGGAILNGGTATITKSVIANNQSGQKGGAIRNTGTAIISGTILANNNSLTDEGEDSYGTYTSAGNNLLTSTSTGNGFTHGLNNDHIGSVDQVVTSLVDIINGGDDFYALSLREAVINANASNGTVWVPAWRHQLTITGAGDSQGDFDITGAVTVTGIGAGLAVIDAKPLINQRHFEVTAGGNLNLSRVTLTGGNAATSSPGGNGGAIYVVSGGVLTLTDSALVGNAATKSGGAISNAGTANISNSVLAYNQSGEHGGGIRNTGTATISGTVIANNDSLINSGEDVYGTYVSAGNNLLTNIGNATGFTQGVANDHVGAVDHVVTSVRDVIDRVDDARALTLREAVIDANGDDGTAWLAAWQHRLTLAGMGDSAGDLDITGTVTIMGTGAGLTIADANSLTNERIFDVATGGELVLSRVTLTGGNASGASPAGHGGAIYVQSGGVLELSNSALVDNTAASDGGAIYNIGTVTITDSVLANNQSGLKGGAIRSTGTATVSGTILANNNSLSNQGEDAYGLYNSGGNNRLTNKSGATGFTQGSDHEGSVNHVVTSIADSYNHVDDVYELSVRETIDSANTMVGAEEIWLPAWGFILTRDRATFGQGTTDTSASFGDLDVDDSLTIRGVNGSTSVAWRAGVTDKIFELLGDYNNDGVTDQQAADVDASDWVIWQSQNGQSGSDLAADGDDDGDVDQDDYNVWASNFGTTLMLYGVMV
ncbi:MAG: S8 family serine peptidase [Pirellulales bacterium]